MDENVKLCLCSILRDESDNVVGMLSSALDYIDYAIIADTGSLDDTKAKVVNFMSEHSLKYELHDDVWQDFATNRNLVIRRAPEWITHILILDGDERLVVKNPVQFKSDLSAHDVCLCKVITHGPRGDLCITYPNIYRRHPSINYKGKIHEQPYFPSHFQITEVYVEAHISHTQSPKKLDTKFQRDLAICLQDENIFPDNLGRREYYIAECYLNLNEPQQALDWFKKRSQIWVQGKDKDDEERWHSGFSECLCLIHMGELKAAKERLQQVCLERPTRAEPLEVLGHLMTELGEKSEAASIWNRIKTMSFPEGDRICINVNLYRKTN